LAAVAATDASLNAQEIGPGMGDVFGTIGFAKSSSGGGTHASLSGGGSLGVIKNLLVSGEFTYVPLGSVHTNFGNVSSRMLMFDGAAQYVFPLTESKLQPYALAGLGVARTSVSGSGYIPSASDSAAVFVWGAGVRIPLTEKLGIKPEFKAYTHDSTLFRVGVGVYYQFGQ